MTWPRRILLALSIALSLPAATVRAETALVAIATNFSQAAVKLVDAFETATPHRISMTLGSTGKLYAQIRAGAPFDAFLAADQARPEKLIQDGLAVSDSQFTYATGQLSVWTANSLFKARHFEKALASPLPRSVAIANPELAPYGAAARQALKNVKLWERLRSRIVMGENIGQTFGLIATGNAAFGFVSRSQMQSKLGKALKGRRWDVPANLHDPIKQDAVLLKRAGGNKAATAFLSYLRTPKARAIMSRLGYNSAIE